MQMFYVFRGPAGRVCQSPFDDNASQRVADEDYRSLRGTFKLNTGQVNSAWYVAKQIINHAPLCQPEARRQERAHAALSHPKRYSL